MISHRDDVRFAFLDIETTGLDRKNNYILEVAWLFTDAYFQQVSEPKSFIVDHDERDFERAIQQIDESPFLTNMHGVSGLYDDLKDPEVEKTPMLDILAEFIMDARDHGAPEIPFRFAGYSVSFDREFLAEHGWYNLINSSVLGMQMHHRILDISSMIQLFEGAGRDVPFIVNDNAHRGLDDSIHAMRTVQEMAKAIGLRHPDDA